MEYNRTGISEQQQELLDRFFNYEIGVTIFPRDSSDGKFVKYQPEDYLYRVNSLGKIVITSRGQWAIMDALVPIILKHVNGPIIEIGMGESSQVLHAHAIDVGVKLYSCDIQMGGWHRLFDEPLSDSHICFVGRSEDFIKDFNENPSVVFIDGEHTYETAKMEVDFFLGCLTTNGVMFLDDMFHKTLHHYDAEEPMGDIWKNRQELELNPDIDVMSWPYTGLTVVMKHDKARPYWRANGRNATN